MKLRDLGDAMAEAARPFIGELVKRLNASVRNGGAGTVTSNMMR
ncbi:MAG TPA: hypothetical protein VEK11_01525 [Thermoanaerobaculia bacterium]|nr:hypothetical protein [Thermoanaerobaculia bacterium]